MQSFCYLFSYLQEWVKQPVHYLETTFLILLLIDCERGPVSKWSLTISGGIISARGNFSMLDA